MFSYGFARLLSRLRRCDDRYTNTHIFIQSGFLSSRVILIKRAQKDNLKANKISVIKLTDCDEIIEFGNRFSGAAPRGGNKPHSLSHSVTLSGRRSPLLNCIHGPGSISPSLPPSHSGGCSREFSKFAACFRLNLAAAWSQFAMDILLSYLCRAQLHFRSQSKPHIYKRQSTGLKCFKTNFGADIYTRENQS
jgi:hypothetical protein